MSSRNCHVIHLRTKLLNILLHQHWIHGGNSWTPLGREIRFTHVAELGLADEADLNSIALQNHGAARFRQIVATTDVRKIRLVRTAQRVKKAGLLSVEGVIIRDRDYACAGGPEGLCALRRPPVPCRRDRAYRKN